MSWNRCWKRRPRNTSPRTRRGRSGPRPAPRADDQGAAPPGGPSHAPTRHMSVAETRASPEAARPILAVNNIEVIYDHVILVLKGVSLSVPAGGIVALLGANGAGKTTTLKAISNLLRA